MTSVHVPDTHASRLDSESVTTLREQLAGTLLAPGAPGYDDARQLWNGMIDKRPALIAQCAGVSDVRRSVTFARQHDLRIAIRGGGHNVAGHALCADGLVIDLSRMRGVRVDPMARTARVEGGATWADFDRETQAFGLATTGGAVSTTGVAGLTLGGGIGTLVGKFGMTIDNLLSVDLVTADGEFLTASAAEHSELFWALRGGGGNFGVATSFEFSLHPLGKMLAGFVAHPADKARDVLDFYREFSSTAPDEVTTYGFMFTDPESMAPLAGIAVFYSGNDLSDGERVIEPLRNFGSPLIDLIAATDYVAAQQSFDPLFPKGRRYYWKSNMLRELSDETLEVAVAYGSDRPSPATFVTFEHYHGAFNRVDPTATAYPHRDAHYQFIAIGGWDEPELDDTGIAWARGLYNEARPHSLQREFLNFNAADQRDAPDRVRVSFGPNWERLVEVKRRYDPDNIFQENNNISPVGP